MANTTNFTAAISILFAISVFANGQERDSYFDKGKLFIVNSSHQDIAWMDAPEVCVRFRDENLITPALRRLAESDDFCFSVEDALSLKEYLGRHPEKYDEILKYTKEGRLEWGATYKQPYQSMHDGEALIRQAYFGRKWLKKVLPGCEFTTAWNEDVPGMALQFPQIMSKAGIPYYQFSRHQPGYYKWYSPDGSFLLCWTPGQYECAGRPIRNAADEQERSEAFDEMLAQWGGYFSTRNIAPGFPFIHSYDFATPLDYDDYIDEWNREVAETDSAGRPYMQYATSTMAMDYVSGNPETHFDELIGERPDVWLYIHGPSHHKAVSACRDASRILTAAEKFSTFDALVENSFAGYPFDELQTAWEAVVYPDHGWGGKNGHITDRYFRDTYEKALRTGTDVLDTALESISEKISYRHSAPVVKAVTVFNPLSWERTDPVEFTIDVEGRSDNHFELVDADGNTVPYQLTVPDSYGKSRDELLSFVFIADDVPSMGYKTYYLREVEFSNLFKPVYQLPVYENDYYRVEFGNGGITSLYDKQLGKEYVTSEKFAWGEMFTMQSVGNGAGEFTDIQQPTMEGFDRTGNYGQAWQCVESGPVYDSFQLIQPMRDCRAKIRMDIYRTIKRIDVVVDIDGFAGENWREFRLAFPVDMKNPEVSYEVPMGVVEVGKDEIKGTAGFSKPEQIYSTPCKDVRPREVQDWFSASDGKNGITISSDVAVFDWIDPTAESVDYVILQPLLLASRKSCHNEGNYYLQSGNHSYSFSVFTHKGNWLNGYRAATQTKQPLRAVVMTPESSAGVLPDMFSFCRTEGEGVIVSTVKKCDDDDSVVMRCYDIEGKDTELSFKMFLPIKAAYHTDIIEENGTEISVENSGISYPIGHHSIETFKFYPQNNHN